jgi:hypothetical protein
MDRGRCKIEERGKSQQREFRSYHRETAENDDGTIPTDAGRQLGIHHPLIRPELNFAIEFFYYGRSLWL